MSLFAIFFTACLVEGAYFYLFFTKNVTIRKADLIVVFAGGYERIKPAYSLANSGYAQYLVISPADESTLRTYKDKYKLSSGIQHIVEVKARTTFENALYTSKIIKEHNFDSVILVTSSYHLPRSSFLLKALLLGEEVRVLTFGVHQDLEKTSDRLPSSTLNTKTYNEMVKLWGSILEFISYKIRGGVPEEDPNNTKFIRSIRSLLLAEVVCPCTTLKLLSVHFVTFRC